MALKSKHDYVFLYQYDSEIKKKKKVSYKTRNNFKVWCV